MAEEETVVKTVENVDRLFSEIVVNGESHVSERYVAPAVQNNSPAPQQTSPVQQTTGEDVYAVELNSVLHNFVDRMVTQGLADEVSARQLADSLLQGYIDAINALIPSSASSSNKLADSSSVSSVASDVSDIQGKIPSSASSSNKLVDSSSLSAVQANVQGIEDLIPAQATEHNQLADKDFVNSSIATNTANFIGTFESVTLLRAYSGTVTNNDYAFVRNTVVQYNGGDFPNVTTLNSYDKTTLTNGDYAWVVNSEDNTKYDLYRFDIVEQSWVLRNAKIDKSPDVLNNFFNRYKATVSGSTVTWAYEYTLNNSSFTASQWATINSGLTSTSVSDAINALDVNQAGGAGKYIQAISEADGKISATEQTMDTAPTQNSTNACTSGGIYTALQNVTVPVDTAMSDSSTNAVQNKVIKAYVDGHSASAVDTVQNGNMNAVTSNAVYNFKPSSASQADVALAIRTSAPSSPQTGDIWLA